MREVLSVYTTGRDNGPLYTAVRVNHEKVSEENKRTYTFFVRLFIFLAETAEQILTKNEGIA